MSPRTVLRDRLRPRSLRLFMASALIMSSIIGASPARAITTDTCKTGVIAGANRCNAIAELFPDSDGPVFRGVSSSLRTSCMYTSRPNKDTVVVQTFLDQNDKGHWIEAGLAHGAPEGARDYFYWAHDRPGATYKEHDDEIHNVSRGYWYHQSVIAITAQEFQVQIGPYTGLSDNWARNYLFTNVYTGTETISQNELGQTAVRGGGADLTWYGPNNDHHDKWVYGTQHTKPLQVPIGWGFVHTLTLDEHYATGTYDGDC